MKKVLFFAFAFSSMAVGAMAQSKASFAGTWNLDTARTKTDAPMRGGSPTLTVTQSSKELTVTTVTKRPEPSANAPAGPPPGGGPGRGMGRGLGMGGDGTVTYSLENKATVVEVDGPMGKTPVTYKASKEADGSLKLSSSQVFRNPAGNEITLTRKEVWKLSADGNSLTVEREQSSPNGNRNSTLVFTRG